MRCFGAWGDDISDERKAELESRLQAWDQETDHGNRKGPFDGAGLSEEEREHVQLTGADALWLAARVLADSADKLAAATQREELILAQHDANRRFRLNLSKLNLSPTVGVRMYWEPTAVGNGRLEPRPDDDAESTTRPACERE